MKMKQGIILVLLKVLIVIVTGRMSVVLDEAKDMFRSWNIKGSFDYFPNGYKLLDIRRDRLPSDFNFKPFLRTKGIWVIIPDSMDQNEVNSVAANEDLAFGYTYTTKTVNTSTSFKFSSFAQLMESVSVRYCLGGSGARIFIRKGVNEEPSYTIAPSPTAIYNWTHMNIPLSGTSQFMVEAHVELPNDFVLIDRIEGFYSESTTSSTPRPKTSPRPHTTHPPKSTGRTFAGNPYFIFIFALIRFLFV